MIVMRFFWPIFWGLAGVLVVYAWISMRRRMRREVAVPPPRIVEDDIRRIVEEGALLTDDPEPLDLEQIAKDEDEFWNESWDEAVEL